MAVRSRWWCLAATSTPGISPVCWRLAVEGLATLLAPLSGLLISSVHRSAYQLGSLIQDSLSFVTPLRGSTLRMPGTRTVVSLPCPVRLVWRSLRGSLCGLGCPVPQGRQLRLDRVQVLPHGAELARYAFQGCH